ncbi:MAG: DUF4198 domain-containing protein [Rubrivivax sp.]|nr:DUF4198 domain-containing protein [Pyrinomonadaceae bacterium]
MRPVSAVALMLLLALATTAHDYWLEPELFFVGVGDKINLRLFLGEGLRSEEERPFQKERTVSFRLHSEKESRDLMAEGEDGKMPVARIALAREGNHLIEMVRNASTIKLDAEKFKAYLEEEGLQNIIAERKRSGEDKREGRERYTRYLKSLLQAGAMRDDTFSKILGHRLEVVPLANPYGLRRSDAFRVRILFEGKPLTGATVEAFRRDGGSMVSQHAATDSRGEAGFKLDGAGAWNVRLVHMRRCAGADCAEIDWESFWASLTFGAK